MKGTGHRRIWQERRRRFDTLHRVPGSTWLAISPGEMYEALLRPLGCSAIPEPFTLDWFIREEMKKHHIDAGKAYLHARAKSNAQSICPQQEPNVSVRAAWGVEKALAECVMGLPFQEDAPHLFIAGVPHYCWEGSVGVWDPSNEQCPYCTSWEGIDASDLVDLNRVYLDWQDIARTGNCPAEWCPKGKAHIYTSDPMRPPVEALVMAASVIREELNSSHPAPFTYRDFHDTRRVVCIGLGQAAGAQVLSALLPEVQMFNDAAPFAPAKPMPSQVDAVVLGIPGQHALDVAKMLSSLTEYSFLDRRKILSNTAETQVTGTHVPQMLAKAMDYKRPGVPMILIADPQAHSVAAGILSGTWIAAPLVHRGIDTSRRAVWCGYRVPPREPHGLLAPSGKVVSFWRWEE